MRRAATSKDIKTSARIDAFHLILVSELQSGEIRATQSKNTDAMEFKRSIDNSKVIKFITVTAQIFLTKTISCCRILGQTSAHTGD